VRQAEGYLMGRKEVRLYYWSCLPEGEENAVVVIVHGVAEHCGRYLNLTSYLVSAGFAVYGFDLRNHGKSAGEKGNVEHFSYFQDDLCTFMSLVRTQNPQKKIFLFGHSMGATIALDYSIRYQNDISGLIVSGSAIKLKPNIPPVLIALLWPLAVFMPGLGLKKLDSSFLSHNPEVVRSYDTDPLVYRGRLKARLAIELTWNMHKLEGRLPLAQTPLLALHGEADQIASPQGSRFIYEKTGSLDKTLKIYPGLYHEILNEPQNMQVMVDIQGWLQKHS
jgi:acylglycerol lipase